VLLALTAAGNAMLLRALPAWSEAQERSRPLVGETLLDLGAGRIRDALRVLAQ
jgi:hypothetical protein